MDDPVVPDFEIPLTEAEAELLGLQVFRQALVEALGAQPDSLKTLSSGPMTAPEQATFSDSASVACPAGGSIDIKVTLTAVVDEAAQRAELDFGLVETHRGCGIREGDVDFLLDGAPNISLDMVLTTDGSGVVDVSGSMTGGVTVVVGYAAETCAVDVHFTGQAMADGATHYEFVGSVCGEDVANTVALDESA